MCHETPPSKNWYCSAHGPGVRKAMELLLGWDKKIGAQASKNQELCEHSPIPSQNPWQMSQFRSLLSLYQLFQATDQPECSALAWGWRSAPCIWCQPGVWSAEYTHKLIEAVKVNLLQSKCGRGIFFFLLEMRPKAVQINEIQARLAHKWMLIDYGNEVTSTSFVRSNFLLRYFWMKETGIFPSLWRMQ